MDGEVKTEGNLKKAEKKEDKGTEKKDGVDKKEEADLKKQLKVLKAAYKEEHKKNTQCAEDIKILTEKLARSDEQVTQLVC